jgi:hypothetical protein
LHRYTSQDVTYLLSHNSSTLEFAGHCGKKAQEARSENEGKEEKEYEKQRRK